MPTASSLAGQDGSKSHEAAADEKSARLTSRGVSECCCDPTMGAVMIADVSESEKSDNKSRPQPPPPSSLWSSPPILEAAAVDKAHAEEGCVFVVPVFLL